jgi:hypothetical protein
MPDNTPAVGATASLSKNGVVRNETTNASGIATWHNVPATGVYDITVRINNEDGSSYRGATTANVDGSQAEVDTYINLVRKAV